MSGRHGMHLLNQDQGLIFGIAWFWTLPEVHDVQDDIDALAREFRALFPRTADSKDHAAASHHHGKPSRLMEAASRSWTHMGSDWPMSTATCATRKLLTD